MNPFPQQFLSIHVCPRPLNNISIPIHYADGSLYAWASEQRFARLQSAGLVARVVRQRKGRISRAILFLRPGEAKPVSASSVMGTRYSLKEALELGQAWDLKHLDGSLQQREELCAAVDAVGFPPGDRRLHGPVKAKRQIGGRYLARVRGAFRGGQARLFQPVDQPANRSFIALPRTARARELPLDAPR